MRNTSTGQYEAAQTDRPDLIHVCGLERVPVAVTALRASHLVTLINRDHIPQTPRQISPERHLQIAVNDIAAPAPGLTHPNEAHVSQLLEFVRAWDRTAPMVIHCWAGISRSTAAAFISLCALNPKIGEDEIAWRIRESSPTAYPNRLLVAHADDVLGRDGRMLEAVEQIGRGVIAAEGHPFSIPASLFA